MQGDRWNHTDAVGGEIAGDARVAPTAYLSVGPVGGRVSGCGGILAMGMDECLYGREYRNVPYGAGRNGQLLLQYPKIAEATRKCCISLDKSTKKYYSFIGCPPFMDPKNETIPIRGKGPVGTCRPPAAY